MRVISLFTTFIFLTACSSMANIDFDRSVNFSSFSTYSIQAKPVRVDDDTRVTTPFMQERIVKAIDNELTKKGMAKTAGNETVKVKYHINVAKDFESEESTVSIGLGTSTHHSAIGMGFIFPVGETYSYDKLVLTIDIISAKTDKLVWRGSLGYRLDMGATPERYTHMANELVAEILKDYPPK